MPAPAVTIGRPVAGAEELRFGRAAARLHMTQPPLCPAIKQLETDDPLADREILHLHDLADRRWFQLPDGTDPVWRAYWNGATPGGQHRDGPVARTVHECLQAVLWNGTIGPTPLAHALPDGLTSVPLVDMPPSRLVVAGNSANPNPLIRSFAKIAAAIYRSAD